jgi:plasmid stabilization system protein ParE
MGKRIIWRPKAKARFKEIVLYLREEWSERVAQEFVELVEKRLNLLSMFPRIGAESQKKPGRRKLLLTPHNLLAYRIHKDKISILNIYDTRQNPTKTDV